MLDLTDQPRTALVTGASRGIGRGIAIRLASMGHSVAVNYNSHEDEALEVVEEIRSAGGTATAVGGSVASKEGCEQIVAGAVETLGPVEILINNAGVISDSLLLRMKDEQLE
ncbi:MAG: SDR family NAD(P)-dependent oxidoreductase, partial [Chloroflexi bacterium]|nr:SDR family NAD(P)-dependent oxidoreductase [Chloroflexota bacterium]